jgi:hypothetical protein
MAVIGSRIRGICEADLDPQRPNTKLLQKDLGRCQAIRILSIVSNCDKKKELGVIVMMVSVYVRIHHGRNKGRAEQVGCSR